MPQFKGQLGSKLDVSLSSILISCRWSLTKAATGGEVSLVATTAYVGDGCPFEFTILDENGSKLATLKGKSASNICSVKWTLSDKAKGHLVFLAAASSLNLSGRSDTLLVMEQLSVGPVEAFDDRGGVLAKVSIGQKMRWKAKMPGIPHETQAKWEVLCRQDKAHATVVARGTVDVLNGEAIVDWETQYPMDQGCKSHQHALDKTSEKYEDATFEASFSCLGVTAKSKPVTVKSALMATVHGGGTQQDVKSADGTSLKEELPDPPSILLEGLAVGQSSLSGPGEEV